LYGGEIILEFDPARHQYRVISKGRKYKVPSVTAICGILNKPALIPWAINNTLEVCKGAIGPGVEYAETYLEAVWEAAKKASADIKRSAAERGKSRHAEIERSLNSLDSRADGGQDDLRKWLQTITFEVVAVERRIYSRRHRFSGTLDCITRSKDGLVLIDWKTSKSIYPEFRLQTAAYQLAWEEEHPDQPIEGRYLVRIAEDGSVEPHYFPRSTYRLDKKGFLGALDLYRRAQQIEKEFKKSVITSS
jgi:hypothetical protein